MSKIKISTYLEELEQIQNPETRRNSLKSKTDRYTGSNPAEALVEDNAALQSVIPSHKESFQSFADIVAGDVEVGNDEIGPVYNRVCKAIGIYTKTEIENIKNARAETLQQLRATSDPHIAENEQLNRYMNELNLTGLSGKNQWQILQKASAAATSPDPGETAFWSRNFNEVFSNAVKGGAPAGQPFDQLGDVKRVSAALDAATTRKMSPAQLRAREQLADFETAWEQSGIEKTMQLVEASIEDTGDLRVAKMVAPRERTSQENRVADARQKIRQVKAERDAEATEKQAFDALG
jgi:hypothetical protein